MILASMSISILIMSAGFSQLAQGQATANLPRAEEILDRYVEATGGKSAYEKFTNRVSSGTLEIVGANVKGKLEITQASPNKLTTMTDLGPIGKSRQGTDGEVAWEISTFTGERILEGDEKDAVAVQALFNAEIRSKERYTKVECVGVEDVNGKPAAKLILSRKSGKPVVEFYDTASHLLVKQVITTKGPTGEFTIDQYIGDYKKVDGVLMPHSVRQKMLGQEMILSFNDIKHNVELPAECFALPKEISALQKKKSK